MTLTPIPSELETPADLHARRVQRHLLALDALIEIGMDLMRLVQSQAKAEVEIAARLGEPAPDFTVSTERMFRTVRRTMLLSQKLAQPVKAAAPAPQSRVAARQQIIRGVEDSIERDAPPDAVDSLHAEFAERLDSLELADDIDQRPVEDIITEIRRDLGIAAAPGFRLWKRRTPQDVARLCARAATPRAATGPFVLPMPARAWSYVHPLFPQGEDGLGEERIRGP